MVNVYWVVDENQSPHMEHNYMVHTDKVLGSDVPTDPNFHESNLKYTINGYLYCNQPAGSQVINAGDKVRWYVGAVGLQGSEQGVHTPHYHGNTWVNTWSGVRQDELNVIPGTVRTLDMEPDAVGVWMAHCHVNHHIHAGMITTYEVVLANKKIDPNLTGQIRTYYVAADEVRAHSGTSPIQMHTYLKCASVYVEPKSLVQLSL